MRFLLFVEGDLEKRVLPSFLERWLRPRLNRSVEIQVVWNFRDCGRFIREIGQAARGYLESPNGEEAIAAIGLLDLKGPENHAFYPADKVSIEERYRWGVEELTNRVRHPKFRMYFAVHEFEAWLLSQPDIFPPKVRRLLREDERLPESVNFDEPPARVIERLYRERQTNPYRKISHGVGLFNALDPAAAYERCPHLRTMLKDMLELAHEAGF